MGLLTSMYTARSGLTTLGDALGVYGDNIANANTTGFKTSRPEFGDVMVKGMAASGSSIGRGVQMTAVQPLFSQGSIIQTDSPTDLSITGDGFFLTEGVEGRTYTRAGAFHFDKEGKLITADNTRIIGFQADDKGKITSKLGPIAVGRTVIDAKGTNEVKLFANLDFRSDPRMKFDPTKPEQSSHFATGLTLYDTAGMAHTCTAYFNKTGDGEWEWRVMAKGEEVVGGKPDTMVEQAKGKLKFDTDGRLLEQETDESSFNFAGGAKPDQNIKFNFGEDKSKGGDGLAVTQYGTNSEAYKTVQDGYATGTLVGLSFNEDGILQAIYSNNEYLNIAQIAVSRFENPEALLRLGGNKFRETRVSGAPTTGAPQSGGRGKVSPKTLETSTTDIANEFINLMNSQRSFQANGKVITAADEMMGEVLNLKRG